MIQRDLETKNLAIEKVRSDRVREVSPVVTYQHV